MLTYYIYELARLTGNREEAILVILDRTVNFLQSNLISPLREKFISTMQNYENEDKVEDELKLLIKYLMKVPNVKYKLDSYMRAIIVDYKYQLLQELKKEGVKNG